jgi:hypothetical protein
MAPGADQRARPGPFRSTRSPTTRTPRSAHRAPPRDPDDLIADGPALVAVITATHHAVDGLARTADSDVQAIFDAARGGRLYQSRLTLPGWQRARERYVPATQEAIDRLLDSYQSTARAARRQRQSSMSPPGQSVPRRSISPWRARRTSRRRIQPATSLSPRFLRQGEPGPAGIS